jgi:hypothetical protein
MHNLRRRLSTFQIDTGRPLEVIKNILRHESKTTTETYARLAMEPVRLSLEKATGGMLRHSGRSRRDQARRLPFRHSSVWEGQ